MYLFKYLFFLSIFFLTSCSDRKKETSFQSLQQKQSKLTQTQFAIEFRAGGMTSFEKVQEYAMKKAAQTTLNEGYQYFKVIKKQNISVYKKISRIEPDKIEDYVLFSTIKQGEDIIERSPGVKLTIQCYQEDPRLFRVIDAKAYLEQSRI